MEKNETNTWSWQLPKDDNEGIPTIYPNILSLSLITLPYTYIHTHAYINHVGQWFRGMRIKLGQLHNDLFKTTSTFKPSKLYPKTVIRCRNCDFSGPPKLTFSFLMPCNVSATLPLGRAYPHKPIIWRWHKVIVVVQIKDHLHKNPTTSLSNIPGQKKVTSQPTLRSIPYSLLNIKHTHTHLSTQNLGKIPYVLSSGLLIASMKNITS